MWLILLHCGHGLHLILKLNQFDYSNEYSCHQYLLLSRIMTFKSLNNEILHVML
jgi:hypothetical protein